MFAQLTAREADVLLYVAMGKTDWEIGKILEISPNTVRKNLKKIYHKLDVVNRPQAVFEGMRFQIIPLNICTLGVKNENSVQL